MINIYHVWSTSVFSTNKKEGTGKGAGLGGCGFAPLNVEEIAMEFNEMHIISIT